MKYLLFISLLSHYRGRRRLRQHSRRISPAEGRLPQSEAIH